jgi:phosphotriesterase-related protein
MFSGPFSFARNGHDAVMTSRREFLAQTALAGIGAALPGPVAAASNVAQTVLGPRDASTLGFTLPHEHVADGPYYLRRWPKNWSGKAGLVARAVEKLAPVRAAGVGTIVDLTPYDVWRDIGFLEEVSRKSGLTMIAATGQRFFPPKVAGVTMPARDLEGLAAFFAREITHGIDGTAIKAGVIKIGIVGGTPTALEETGLRAAVRAARATGAPIRIHTHSVDRAGDSLAVILEDEGMDPARVSFDHSDDSGEIDYFLGLVRRGYCLGMDHVHRGLMAQFKPIFAQRLDCIKRLADAGFARNVFLSQDLQLGGALMPGSLKEWRDTIDPPEGMLFVPQRLIPQLEEIGVSARDIHTMTVENPRRFFSFI